MGGSGVARAEGRATLAHRATWGYTLPSRSTDRVELDAWSTVAVQAEEHGFADVWVTENTLDRVYSLDPVVALSAAAAVTSRIRLGVAVSMTAVHSPVTVAHQWASLDVVSGGRAVLATGLGRPEHFRDFGVPQERRVGRFLEGLRVMRALWSHGDSDALPFRGEFYDVEHGFALEPVQRPLPVWFGGGHANALARAARHADGWMASGQSGVRAFAGSVATLRARLDELGRDVSAFPISKRVFLMVDETPARALAALERWFGEAYGDPSLAHTSGVYGTAEHVAETLHDLIDAGATHLLLNPVSRHLQQLEAVVELLDRH